MTDMHAIAHRILTHDYPEAKKRAATAEAKLGAIAELIATNGCDCDCGCDSTGHVSDECEPCLACFVNAVIAGEP
jgi:hypothetical protein